MDRRRGPKVERCRNAPMVWLRWGQFAHLRLFTLSPQIVCKSKQGVTHLRGRHTPSTPNVPHRFRRERRLAERRGGRPNGGARSRVSRVPCDVRMSRRSLAMLHLTYQAA